MQVPNPPPPAASPPLPLPYGMHDSDSSLSDLSTSDSELSSVGSMSPPLGYLSPASSQGTEPASASELERRKRGRADGDENAPVRKKRRTPEPKPRTTQHLDLRASDAASEQEEQVQLLLKVLRKRRKIVVVAGAGISVSAGIPDFRSSTGLFKSLKSEHKLKASGKALFDASVYQTEDATTSFHDMVRNLSTMVSSAKPTAFHQMLARLGDEGRLMRLYTQNVDGIDTQLPSLQTAVPLPPKGPWPRSVQLHGGLEKMVCTKCHQLSDFAPDLFEGPAPPPCATCIEADRVRTSHAGKRSHGVGRLRPRMVLYNEHNPDEEAIGSCVSADLRARPDALIVVGTSMKIPGVKRIVREMCGVVRSRRDGLTVWLNHDDPPPGKEFEDCWDLVIKGPCDEVARQWTMAEAGTACTSSDTERAKEGHDVSVIVPPSPKKTAAELAMVTPASTPKQQPLKPLQSVPKIILKVKPPADKDVKKAGKGRPRRSAGDVRQKAVTKKTTSKGQSKKTVANDASSGIQGHFKVTKASNAQAVEVSKVAAVKAKETGPMEPVPSSNHRINRSLNLEVGTQKLQEVHEAKKAPSTPLRVEIPLIDGSKSWSRRSSLDTISPTSVPKGMQALLD